MNLKFLDYRSLYIEQLFAEMSFSTSRENSYSPNETINYLTGVNIFKRISLFKNIIRTVKYLASLPTTRGYLPIDVLKIAEFKYPFISASSLLPFFVWLKDLYKTNKENRSNWLLSFKDCCSRIDDNTGDFLLHFTRLSGQRAVFTKSDEGIAFFTAIHSWGTVEVYFENSSLLTEEFESIVGNIGCIEAEYIYDAEQKKGSFELTFLVDTQIYENDLCQRAFSDEGWTKIKISCDNITSCPKFCNYAEKPFSFGQSYKYILNECVNSLIDKEAVVGQRALTGDERKLVPLSKFLFALGLQNDGKNNISFSGKLNEAFIFELLDNHVAFDTVIDTFSGIKTECSHYIADTLKKIDQQFDPEYPADVFIIFRSLKKYVSSMDFIGQFESTAKIITDYFKKTASDYDYRYASYNSFCVSKEIISLVMSEYLKNYGYEGEFPNYRKKGKKYNIFISVVCNGSFLSNDNRFMKLDFYLAASRQNAKRIEKLAEKSDYVSDYIPFEQLNAESSFAYSCERTARIGTESDFGYASIVFPTEESEKLTEYVNDFAVKLNILCNQAFHFTEGKPFSAKYRLIRFFASLKNRLIFKSLANSSRYFAFFMVMSFLTFHRTYTDYQLFLICLLLSTGMWIAFSIFKWITEIFSSDDYNRYN